jgi:3-hydroxyacyl-CoA dehydrogenase
LDAAKGDYVPGGAKADEVVGRMLKKPAAERLKLLRERRTRRPVPVGHPARRLPLRRRAPGRAIADNARDVDFAMRWGFGMKQGPFELWQEAGWQQVAQWVKEDIDAGKALCKAPLPAWVFDGPVASRRAHAEGSWSAAAGLRAAQQPAGLRRQHFPESRARQRRRRRAEGRHRGVQERRGCASGRSTARC